MIRINKTPNADSRTAKEITLEDLDAGTRDHINHVKQGLNFFANKLENAGHTHDYTKLLSMEDFYDALINNKPGEDVKNSRWYNMHIHKERHHLLSRVPDDVNLIDVFEYLTDCIMAGMSRAGEVYDLKVPDELLQKAYKNTCDMLQKQIKIAE